MPGNPWMRLRRKIIGILIIGFSTWIVSDWVGFPRIFRWYFVGYILLAFFFFLLLDAPPGRPPSHPALAIFGLFLLLSALLTGVGLLLPQYDPGVEMEKIQRLQEVAREKEEARQIDILRRLAEKRGFTVAKTGETVAKTGETPKAGSMVPTEAPQAPESPPALVARAEVADPRLVKRGRQTYNDYECYNCHKVGGKGGVKRRGPELGTTGTLLSAEMIRSKLLDPTVFMTEGYEEEYRKTIMPDDLKDRMGPREIEAIVAYMVSLQDEKATPPTPKPLFKTPKGWEFIPKEFQKVMPTGWWTDPEVLKRGREIYEGMVRPEANCSACHGRDGQPILTGARDFRNPTHVAEMSETYWFWRVSEGVPQTPMTPMKERLTEGERWRVIAYQHMFSHGGEPEGHVH